MRKLGYFRLAAHYRQEPKIENDLALELNAVKQLNASIKISTEAGVNASQALFEESSPMRKNTWIIWKDSSTRLRKSDSKYLSQQLYKGDEKE